MQIDDEGFFLGSKKYGENSKIIQIFSKKNGIINGFVRQSKKNKISLINLDRIFFTWKSRDADGLGYIIYDLKNISYSQDHNYILSLIKASASELCMKFLPSWENNEEIFDDLNNLLSKLKNNLELENISEYIFWEFNFLKNLGYGLDFNKCAVTGSNQNISFLSPKSGNVVCYEVGVKYKERLFNIPKFLIERISSKNCQDYCDAFKISTYFLEKVLEKKLSKLIFRNQLLLKIKNL